MKEKNQNSLINGLKIAATPIVWSAKVFVLPLSAPYILGKKILDTVKNAKGRPGHEVNSFDVWYKIHRMNEDRLAFNIRKTASLALMCLVMFFISLALTYISYKNNVMPIFVSSGFVASMIIFAQYFHFVVFCHCFKKRSFENKLDAFKSLESIFPNPFWENVEVKNSDGKKVHAEFYPKGKKILKK